MTEAQIIIPSWDQLSSDLESETGSKYAALIPLGGRPLYKHIIENLQPKFAKSNFKLILPTSAPALEIFFDSAFDCEVISLKHSNSIAETIVAGLQNIVKGQPVVVNMADTLANLDDDLELDCVYTDIRSDLYRWTNVFCHPNGVLNFPYDRDGEESFFKPQEVCVGIFSFSDGLTFKNILKKIIVKYKGKGDPFFAAITEYSREMPMSLNKVADWFDCGHIDTFYESRLNYQNLRHFNSLSYDAKHGLVTKTSRKKEQFRHQVRWYRQVPDSLNVFLPRIFESSDGDEPFITMELLSIPTLSDLYLTKRLPFGAWNGVLNNIIHIQSELGSFKFETQLSHILASSLYLEKTRSRIEDFIKQDPHAFNYYVHTSSGKFGLAEVINNLEQFVQCNGLLDIESLSPIHGDFCFSNILYDSKSRIVKMIDPRGEFGVPGIYGDLRYDLAKLSHSYNSGYDFIISDRFTLDVSADGQIRFTNNMDAYHHRVGSIFKAALIKDADLNQQVSAIEALLFLSMLPLHVDTPKRQLGMLATGLQLFHRISQEISKH